ncbi:bifunctional isocitrate dehydrogenase kinase/phosphatase [Roseateles sp. BYS78W]|uniref:Isocitrate dehydrogenase kinase/phosphatase n=1 Tax=Pelomonas candidula TaxID=3299025 RepID=A0ABW7H5C8_9BURK
MFPTQLTDTRAFEIARALLGGFDHHYALFRATSAEAKARFERGDWAGQQRAQAQRIEFYDTRVAETSQLLEQRFAASTLSMDVWQQVKLHFIGLLTDHHQPELAETFFNSVCTRILHHAYFHNDFIFVRPAVSTEYIENDEPAATPTYRAYYPTPDTLQATLQRCITNFQLDGEFVDLQADVRRVRDAVLDRLGDIRWRANFQLQVLSSLFYRNKGAYVVGRIINGFTETAFALPILRRADGRFFVDALLFGEDDLLGLFSFARAYFLVDMEVPSAFVAFLRALMPRKPRSEIYAALGLQKQGKALFYRDFLRHLRHSSDAFRIAPGIKGMVMLVFDLPSYPFVFKVVKDFYPAPKDTTREQVQAKYRLVKAHDRVGRMADTLEYTRVAFPRQRFDDELVAELKHFCPSLIEESGDDLVIRHVYIERRMVPLNLYLQDATPEQVERVVVEYGNAIKDLVAANIFPGDMLWKNFGVTRHGKVVFYDYDEIEYLTDCNFRRVPEPRNEEEAMSGEVWWHVAPRDVFPETFAPFLLGNPQVRDAFMRHHADLLDADFWQVHKERILAGHVHDVFPYDASRRFAAAERGSGAGRPGAPA